MEWEPAALLRRQPHRHRVSSRRVSLKRLNCHTKERGEPSLLAYESNEKRREHESPAFPLAIRASVPGCFSSLFCPIGLDSKISIQRCSLLSVSQIFFSPIRGFIKFLFVSVENHMGLFGFPSRNHQRIEGNRHEPAGKFFKTRLANDGKIHMALESITRSKI